MCVHASIPYPQAVTTESDGTADNLSCVMTTAGLGGVLAASVMLNVVLMLAVCAQQVRLRERRKTSAHLSYQQRDIELSQNKGKVNVSTSSTLIPVKANECYGTTPESHRDSEELYATVEENTTHGTEELIGEDDYVIP